MRLTYKEDIELRKISALNVKRKLYPVLCTDRTMEERKQKVLAAMRQEQLDAVVVYGDLEHGSNFEYLCGFLTRFEEGMLVLHQDGTAYLLLGNENLNKASKARIAAQAIHVPYFSLPNQPMEDDRRLEDYFTVAGLKAGMKTGLVGWKMFTSKVCDNRKLYDVPHYLVEALGNVVGRDQLENRCDLFIGSACGVRTRNNANEIAHYEFGSQLASEGMLEAMNQLHIGMSEMELGGLLNRYGQPNSVVTIAAAGERFVKANLYPGANQVKLQDPISLTVGYKGGLSSRAGVAVQEEMELSEEQRDYLDALAKPYYAAVVTWLENIRIGMKGKELYAVIEKVLPKAEYHWSLNPGHLVADEEWMSSPIYEGSEEVLASGMLLQIDIIPGKSGYPGVSCESGIALADEKLKEQIREEYPDLYQIFEERRAYMREQLGIEVSEDVLLMNDTVAYLRPFLLNKEEALGRK